MYLTYSRIPYTTPEIHSLESNHRFTRVNQSFDSSEDFNHRFLVTLLPYIFVTHNKGIDDRFSNLLAVAIGTDITGNIIGI